MKYLLFIIFLFNRTLFAGTDSGYVDHAAMAGVISNEAIEKICERFDVVPFGSGGGAMDVIRNFDCDFVLFHPIAKEEARRILVESAEIFIECINANRAARPYFIEFPMSGKHFGIGFYVQDPKTYELLHGNSIAIFEFGTNKEDIPVLSYLIQEGKNMPHKKIAGETFEEAKRIVDEERKRDPSLQQRLYKKSYKPHPEKKSKATKGFLSWFANLIGLPDLSLGTKYGKGNTLEQRIERELDEHCQQLAKEKQLRFFRVGAFTGRPYASLPYGFSFLGSQKINLSEAKDLGTTIAKSILQKLNSCSELHARRIRDWDEKLPWASDPNKEIPLKKVCMKIVFWDENNDRITPPHIAQILFLDEKMQYFACDPKTQELKLIFEESYNDALKFKNDADLKK